jgi:uncharacterized protein with FMN-binding domain
MESEGKKDLKTTLAVLVVIVLIVVGVIALTRKKPAADNATSSTPETTQTSEPSNTNTQTTAGAYKDGSYSATGKYTSPGGRESITVKVTLQDGKVTDTSAESGATNRDAQEFQSEFIGAYKQFVVGKNIDDIKLSRVSGSSLTSGGFNAALDQIKSQAKTQG